MQKIVILLAVVLVSAVSEAKLYKWVDDKGRVHYSDTMPESQAATRGTSEMNKRAIIVREAETAEQRAAKIEAKKAEQQAELVRLERARRDKALLDTFANTKEIDTIRDRNLEQIDAAINTNMARRKNAEKRLLVVRKQEAQFLSVKKPVPTDLKLDLSTIGKEITQIDKETAIRRQERAALVLKAEEDKKRLLELRNN